MILQDEAGCVGGFFVLIVRRNQNGSLPLAVGSPGLPEIEDHCPAAKIHERNLPAIEQSEREVRSCLPNRWRGSMGTDNQSQDNAKCDEPSGSVHCAFLSFPLLDVATFETTTPLRASSKSVRKSSSRPCLSLPVAATRTRGTRAVPIWAIVRKSW